MREPPNHREAREMARDTDFFSGDTPPAVGLLQACDDPALFDVTLWPAQRERLALVEEGREHFWCLGRRTGKTFTMALGGLWCCLLRPELLAHLRPGERG